MGQGKWALAYTLIACVLAGRLGAEEPRGEDPFGAESDSSRGEAAASAAIQSVSSTDAEQQAEERIESVLNQPLKSPLEFVETPLNTIAETIADEYDLTILFDQIALESIAQSPDVEVSLGVSNVTLRTALDWMLRQVDDITYIVEGEVLVITTEDEAQARLQTRVYQIDDLLPTQGGRPRRGAPERPQFASIVEVITRCVERESWALNKTGKGEICVVEPGVMVVTQTQRVHAEIARLLATVRRVKAAIPRDALAETPNTSRGGF